MTDPRQHFRLLYIYLGSYLHEDWVYEFTDPQAAFESYLAVVNTSELPQLLQELSDLLSLGEARLDEAFTSLSRNFSPSTDYDWNEREWLGSLRTRAADELAARLAGNGGATAGSERV